MTVHTERQRGWASAHAGINVVSFAVLSVLWLSTHEALLPGNDANSCAERSFLQALLLAQSVWFTVCSALAVVLIESAGFPKVARAFVAVSFSVPALLYIDALVRANSGLHLVELVPIALDAHTEDNRRILEATGIDARAAGKVLACLVPIVLAAAWLDTNTQPLGRLLAGRVGSVKRAQVCLAWLVAFAVLANLEYDASRAIPTASWLRFEHAVPQMLGALGPTPGVLASTRVVARARPTSSSVAAAIARLDFPKEQPGDVFFFVVDSLRGDALTPTLAPALTTLAAAALPIDLALSGGNATHLGWYSLFWSDSALAWRLEPTPDAAEGPIPLQIARRRGWRIEVLSTPDLKYMNLGRVVLGAGAHLADSVLDLHGGVGAIGADDAQVVDEVIQRMGRSHSPTVYLAFLDATHLPYLWGVDFVPPVQPFAGPNHYMHVQRDSADRAAVVARYRDAVAFVDSLLGRFLGALHASGHFDDATVVVVGDHGEEFWEHGLTAHGSELCRVQTRVTLLLKLPKAHPADGDWMSRKPLARTMDVWPTILDASGVRGDTSALFEGVSLAREARRTAVIAGMRYWYPSSRFILDDGQRRVLFELTHPDDPLGSQRLDVVSLLDPDDLRTHPDLTSSQYATIVKEWFGPDLERLFTVTW